MGDMLCACSFIEFICLIILYIARKVKVVAYLISSNILYKFKLEIYPIMSSLYIVYPSLTILRIKVRYIVDIVTCSTIITLEFVSARCS